MSERSSQAEGLATRATERILAFGDWLLYGRTEPERARHAIVHGESRDPNHVFEELIAAVWRARHEVGVACDSCNVDHADSDQRKRLRQALEAAHDRGVDVWLRICDAPDPLFETLEDAGLLRIERLERRQEFSYRVVDGEYRQHEHGAFCHRGSWVETVPRRRH